MRFLEGLSTGSMVYCYLYKKRLPLDILLISYFVHWFFSFLFHITYSKFYLFMDTMLIHIVIAERFLKGNQNMGIIYQLIFLVRNEKYGNVFNVILAFIGTLGTCIENRHPVLSLYFLSIILAGIFYISNWIFYFNYYNKLSSYSITIYHLFLGFHVYYELPFEKNQKDSMLIKILRSLMWTKVLYYFNFFYLE
jgi:hypothetical protein